MKSYRLAPTGKCLLSWALSLYEPNTADLPIVGSTAMYRYDLGKTGNSLDLPIESYTAMPLDIYRYESENLQVLPIGCSTAENCLGFTLLCYTTAAMQPTW